MDQLPKLLRLREVEGIVGMGASTIYRKMDGGSFPRPVDVGGGSVRWRADELSEWLEGTSESAEGSDRCRRCQLVSVN